MDWKFFAVFYGLYLVYELCRVLYECWKDKMTFRQWWNAPLKKEKPTNFEA